MSTYRFGNWVVHDPADCLSQAQWDQDKLKDTLQCFDVETLITQRCRVIKHPDCCAACAANNDCDKIPMHPRCFPAGTVVSGPRAVASVTRWYSGELVEFKTRSGAVVAATPNHPVLTGRGWVGAGFLHEGGQVILQGRPEGFVVGDLDDYQPPALIEDVARSVGEPGLVTAVSVPVSANDLHGDGVGSKVAVIRAGKSGTADAVVLSERLYGLAGAVTLDPIVKIRRFPFDGHVYNLETRFGWYLADSNVVVHNCRCKPAPFAEISDKTGCWSTEDGSLEIPIEW